MSLEMHFNKSYSYSIMDLDFNILNSYKDETLRPYQQDLKSKIYEEWTTKKSVMLQMPTGTGKTKLFCSIIKDVHRFGAQSKKAFKTLVLTHKEELVRQVYLELGQKYNLASGIIQGKTMEFHELPVQVACVPTLIRRLDKWTHKDFDIIIVDEAHHIKADSYQKIIKAFDRAKLLGLTATPYRLSGEGFTKEFECLITSPTIKEFQKDGFLSQYHYYSIGKDSFVQRTLDSIVKEDLQGDYDSNELIRLYDKDRIRAQIVETYQKYAAGRKGIVYTINQEHNKHLLEAFSEKGIKAAAIDSKTDSTKRTELIEDFRKGEYDILLNVNIFSEGFDCPDIEFIQLARPTKSMSMYLQQVGRGLRPHEEKEAVIILDNVGLYNRFGLPSAKRNWEFYFKGREKNETGKKFVKRSLDIESRQREQDLSEGNEKVDLIYTSYEGAPDEEFSDILDPGIANEVAYYLYNRYCTCAKKVYDEYYKYRYQLCKHELGYYYLKSQNNCNNLEKDNDYFNQFISEKLSRKGGKYWELLYKVWDRKQTVIYHLFYDRIKLFVSAIQFCIDVNNEIDIEEDISKYDYFIDLCKEKYDGFSEDIFRLFNSYGLGKDFLDNHLNRFAIKVLGDLTFRDSINLILHFSKFSNINEFAHIYIAYRDMIESKEFEPSTE